MCLKPPADDFGLNAAEVGIGGDVEGGAVIAPGAIGGFFSCDDVADQLAFWIDDHDTAHTRYPEVPGLVGLDSVWIAFSVFPKR